MNFFSRFFGTFMDPGRTFAALAGKPIWIDALVVLLILTALFSYLAFPISQKDSAQMIEDNAAKLKQKWGEERYSQILERTKNTSPNFRLITSLALAPVTYLIGFLFSALIILGMGRLFSTQGNYLQIFSLLLHANFVDKFLGNALRLVLILSRKSVLQMSTGLPIFFPNLEVTSTLYAILSQVDFFQLWLFGIFGLGLASVLKVKVNKALFISYGFWFLKSLLSVALAIIRLKAFQ